MSKVMGYREALNDGKGHYCEHGDKVYSYQTVIRQTIAGGLTIGNDTRYSVTTSKHQTRAMVRSCDVVLNSVPEGCSDLLALAIERGLVRHYVNPKSNTQSAIAWEVVPCLV